MCCLMTLSLLAVSCGTDEEEEQQQQQEQEEEQEEEIEQPPADKPEYGGILNISLTADVDDFLPWSIFTAQPVMACNEWLWNGDWAKGPAGGYGTNEVGWEASTNIKDLKAYYIADNIRWEVDAGGETGTIYIKIKEGIHYGLDPDNPASVLVGGREVTIDDVLWNFNTRLNDTRNHPGLFLGTSYPWTHGIYGKKIGPQEASFTIPIAELLNGVMLLCDGAQIFPPELDEEYEGDSTTDWNVCFGAGAFMVKDVVINNKIELKRNPNYWGTNPVGPGKGDQLPYLDGVKYIIMPDLSTRQAALRTGQIDQLGMVTIEDRAMLLGQNTELKEALGGMSAVNLLGMRTDIAGTPYANVKVRQAMMMATDFNAINDSLYDGLGHILTWPYWKQKGYEGLYLGLDDPDMPENIKELYVYNPARAKELMEEAGYPDGFKATVVLTDTEVDYYSIVKDMWEEIGIDLEFSIQETGGYLSILYGLSYEEMIVGAIPPPSSWPEVAGYTGISLSNFSRINDPYLNEATAHMLTTAITNLNSAMTETREMMKHLLEGAWVIPTPRYPSYTLWWPWLKNYSGENSVGWLAWNWPWWVYIDQDLKAEMGK